MPISQRRPTLGQLWQVPVFCLGLLTLAGVWGYHAFWRDSAAQSFEKKLSAARAALADTPPKARRALTLAEELLAQSDQQPHRTGELHYLIGSSCIALAGDALEATELWQKARAHLEQADAFGVPEAERVRLTFRLAKAWYHTEGQPERIIDYLKRSVEQAGEDSTEGYGMLAQAYLRLAVPDVPSALEANKKQLALSTDNDDMMAPARLLHGELLLRLKEPAAARRMLSRIGAGSEPAVFARARYLLAQSCQDEGLFAEALKLWEAILAERGASPERGATYWNLGICYRELGRQAEAIKVWEELQTRGGEEGQAAALSLAELRVIGNMPATAFECYERALRDVVGPAGGPAAFRNSLVDLATARRIVERGIVRYREVGDFDRSMRLAKQYERIALPGMAAELRGQAADAWAQERRGASNETEARQHFRAAGLAYLEVAAALAGKPTQTQWLRRSADRFIQANDLPRALDSLTKFLASERSPEQLAEGWFTLAQVYQAGCNEVTALEAYRKCIEFPGPHAYRARYRLAQQDIEKGRLDNAEETLQQNLELMRTTPDDETYKATLFALASLNYQRGNWRSASQRYQEALERYPADPRGTEARHQLADCYRRLAVLENNRLGALHLPLEAQRLYRDQYKLWLQMALANYSKLADDLASRQAVAELTPSEQVILRHADFAIGECKIDLGQYEAAIRHHEVLAARYHHQVDQLQALRQIWRCYWMMKDPDKARTVVKQIETAMKELDDRAFASHPAQQTRQEWSSWLQWAEKQ